MDLRLRAVSLFSWSIEQNARDTHMTTRVTEGAPLVSRVYARARTPFHSIPIPLLNLKKKRDRSQSSGPDSAQHSDYNIPSILIILTKKNVPLIHSVTICQQKAKDCVPSGSFQHSTEAQLFLYLMSVVFHNQSSLKTMVLPNHLRRVEKVLGTTWV